MTDAVYRIVEHDGGWAYKLGDVFSETFPTREAAQAAADTVAEEQRSPGEDEAISWEDEAGRWHDEAAPGTDRPNAYVAGPGPGPDPATPAPVMPARLAGMAARHAGQAGRSGSDVAAADDQASRQPRHGALTSGDQVRSEPLLTALLLIACAYILDLVLRRRA